MKAQFLHAALAAGLVISATGAATGVIAHGARSTAVFPADDTTILHVLNRIGFGARDGDVDRVRSIGLRQYIDQQLHPERVADRAITARLGDLSTLGLSSREIGEQYALPVLMARRERKNDARDSARDSPRDSKSLPPEQQSADGGAPPRMRDPAQQRANRVLVELAEQKVLRAVYSDRQLEEVLTDFWFNHFNVDARKGADRFLLTEYERETIRPHVLGKFRDLLGATAKSPAMLFYLDNWISAGGRTEERVDRGADGGGFARRGAMQAMPVQAKRAQRGLNENYGRELMELHTLGVDGGYTQQDVTEVARSFTGWTIQNPRLGGGFRFEPRLHDEGRKVVLGHVIKAGRGIDDGEEVLDILATHPSTARFVATKLVRRFVSDTPPPALVDRVAARFRETGGDLREVTRTILMSPEFLSPEAVGAKVKTPFEFVVSALRAVNAEVQNAVPVVRAVQQLGMPLYQCQPPTGYKDTADAWINTSALVNRMNFSLQLTSNKLPGTIVSQAVPQAAPDAHAEPRTAALILSSPEFQRR